MGNRKGKKEQFAKAVTDAFLETLADTILDGKAKQNVEEFLKIRK